MHVKQLDIEYFRSFRSCTLEDLTSTVLLIGENDTGKSNILEALRVLFEGTGAVVNAGLIQGKEYLWFGADPKVSPITISATLDLTDSDMQALGGALTLQLIPSNSELHVSLRIEQIGDNVYRRWEKIDGIGLPVVGIQPENNTPMFLMPNGTYSLSADSADVSGKNINSTTVANAVEEFLRSRFKFIGVHREEPPGSSMDEWWRRPTILPTITVEAIQAKAVRTPPAAERTWNRYRRQLNPAIGLIDVGGGSLVFDKMIGGDQISMPLSLKGGGHQAYLHLMEQLESTSADIITIEEPENHLHPRLIKQFMQELAKRCKDGKQFFIATHSPFVINRDPLSSTWFVWQDSGEAKVARASNNEEWRDRLIEIGVSPADFLLSNAILIVEGKSDQTFLSAVARVLERSFIDNEVLVIDAGGDSKQEAHFRFWCEITGNAPLPKFSVLDSNSDSKKRELVDAGMREQNVKVLSLGDIEDYYPRTLIIEWLRQHNWEDGKNEKDFPIGQTVQKLKEATPPGNSDWWKGQLAEYVSEQLKREDVSVELEEYVTDLYASIDSPQ